MFNPAYGLLNEILKFFYLEPIQWLNDINQVIPSLSIMYIWSRLGFDMLILMSGLTAISPDYYEAARIDGANRWHSFWNITLPLLNQQLVLVCVVEIMMALKVFELPYLKLVLYFFLLGLPCDLIDLFFYRKHLLHISAHH